MSNFFQLVQNENMKIYRRPRNWVMAGFMVLAIVAFAIFTNLYTNKASSSDNWKPQLEQSIVSIKQTMKDHEANISESKKKSLEDMIKVSEYRLEHNINPYEKTLWETMKSQSGVIYLVIIFTIVVAADMIASEFTWGTIKLLLIRPASRFKILASKYVSTLLYALFLTVITFVSSFIISGTVHGFSDITHTDLYVGPDGNIQERSMLFVVLTSYGLALVQLLMYVTFAFMISSAFRSASMAIALSLACMFAGNTITIFFNKYEWVKYLLFANIDLNQYLTGTPVRLEMTMAFSIIVLAIYFIIFHLISWFLFSKRDVAA